MRRWILSFIFLSWMTMMTNGQSKRHRIGACLHYRGGEGSAMLIEWIEWHHLIGVAEFFVYEDRKSTESERDETRAAIGCYQRQDANSAKNIRKTLSPSYNRRHRNQNQNQNNQNGHSTMRHTSSHRVVGYSHLSVRGHLSRVANERELRPRVELLLQPEISDARRRKNGGAGMQESFEHCMRTFGERVDWLLFVDNDEFVSVASNFTSIQDLLRRLPLLGNAPGVLMRWKQYVAAGGYESDEHVTRDPSVPISNSLRRRMRHHTAVKLMMRTDAIGDCAWSQFRHVHNCLYDAPDGRQAIAADTLRPSADMWHVDLPGGAGYHYMWINHYFTRSCYEYVHGVLARRHRNMIEDGHIGRNATMDTLPQYHPARMRLDPTLCARRSQGYTVFDVEHTRRMFEPLAHNCRLHPAWPKRNASVIYAQPPEFDNIVADEQQSAGAKR
jgi:hypothetical protein